MDGPGIGIQAGQKAAYEREQRAYGASIAQGNAIGSRSEATLSGLVPSTDELLGLLAELGSRLDRVEVALAGPSVEADGSAAGKERSLCCITDVIDERLSRARMMVSRLHNTVSRIERRIG